VLVDASRIAVRRVRIVAIGAVSPLGETVFDTVTG
jgi:hypothetical protein